MSDASPLAAVAAGVRRLAGIRHGESPEASRDKMRELVVATLPVSERSRVTEFLGELVSIPFPAEDRPTLRQARTHPELMADEMRRAFEELAAGACAATPCVFVVEDAHWVNPLSLKYIDAALRAAANQPLLVVALARPELTAQLWAERGPLQMTLHGLGRKAAELLAHRALPAASDDEVTRIVTLAAGNAFFLEELVRAVRDGHSALPGTIAAMVQARLGALPVQARAVLRAASVFGEAFWESGVDALAGPHACRAAHKILADHDIIIVRSTSRFAGEREYAFRHALLRDSAYALLGDTDRGIAHRLVGAWLEAAGDTRPVVIAGHHERGGDAHRAAKWYLTAAEQAFEHDDVDAAATAAARGLAIIHTDDAADPALLDMLERARETIEHRRDRDRTTLAASPPTLPDSSYRFAMIDGAPILSEVCIGCWSRKFTMQYLTDIKAALSPLLGRPWGKLCNLDGWLSTEPDATELIIDFLMWSMAAQMRFVAYVISNPGMRLQVRRIAETSNVKLICGWFATEAEALAWLLQQDFGSAHAR